MYYGDNSSGGSVLKILNITMFCNANEVTEYDFPLLNQSYIKRGRSLLPGKNVHAGCYSAGEMIVFTSQTHQV